MLTLDMKNFSEVILGEKQKPVMVEFWAPWCGYCQRLSATYDEVAEEYKDDFVIGKVNVDDAMALAKKYQVEIIPTILIFEKGELVKRVVNPPDKAAIVAFMMGNTIDDDRIKAPREDSVNDANKASEALAEPAKAKQQAHSDMPIYSYTLEKPDGELLPLADFQGKVMLIVNTATGCGFTPQYKQLEEMYSKLNSKGLEIIDIPCNQFNGQAPGTDEEIHHFCTVNFGTSFPQMKKSDVNGPNALPLYGYLKSQKGFEGFGSSLKGMAMAAMLMLKDSDYKNNTDIKWNFTKFLIDRKGNVVARFEPTADMKDVAKAVAALL